MYVFNNPTWFIECFKKTTDEKKRKVPADEEFHDDDDFALLLKSIDDEKHVKPSPSKKIKNDPSPSTKIKVGVNWFNLNLIVNKISKFLITLQN